MSFLVDTSHGLGEILTAGELPGPPSVDTKKERYKRHARQDEGDPEIPALENKRSGFAINEDNMEVECNHGHKPNCKQVEEDVRPHGESAHRTWPSLRERLDEVRSMQRALGGIIPDV